MIDKKEIRLRYFEQSSNQRHISQTDHYLYAQSTPTVKLAVIGCGTIGQEHMRVAALLGRARVYGIFDTQTRSVQVAKEEFAKISNSEVICFESLEQACLDPIVDAFVICTPNYTHLDVFKTVMKSGKAILLEKPMATTLHDAAEIVRLSAGYSAPVQDGLQYRYKAIYSEASHEILKRRSIGQVKSLHLIEHRPPFLDKVGQWNKFAVKTGGTLIEKCCHYFDLLNYYAGSVPVRVYAHGSQAVNFKNFEYAGDHCDIMDNASTIIEYNNGVRATFELVMFAPNFHEEMIVCGDEGRLTVRESFNVFQTQSCRSTLHVEHAESGAERKTDVAYPSFIEQSGHHGATYFEHVAFLDRLGGKNTNAVDVLQGFESIVVGAAAEQSAQTGMPVNINDMLVQAGLDEFTKK